MDIGVIINILKKLPPVWRAVFLFLVLAAIGVASFFVSCKVTMSATSSSGDSSIDYNVETNPTTSATVPIKSKAVQNAESETDTVSILVESGVKPLSNLYKSCQKSDKLKPFSSGSSGERSAPPNTCLMVLTGTENRDYRKKFTLSDCNWSIAPAVGAAIIAGAASLIGSGINYANTRKTNEEQRKLSEDTAEKEYERNLEIMRMQNAYNTESMQMLRRRAAGLNPYDDNSVSPQPSAGFEYDQEVPNLKVPQFDVAGPVSNAMSLYLQAEQLQNMDQNTANDTLVSKAQAAKLLADAGYTSEDTKRLIFENSVRQSRFEKEMEMMAVQIEQIKSNTANLKVDNKIKSQINEYYGRIQESILRLNESSANLNDKNAALAEVKKNTEAFQQRYLSALTSESRQKVDNLVKDYAKTIAEISQIDKQTEKMDAEIRALGKLNQLRDAMIQEIAVKNKLTEQQTANLRQKFDTYVSDKTIEYILSAQDIQSGLFDMVTAGPRMVGDILDIL